MSMKVLSFLLAMSFVVMACSNDLRSPSDAFLIPQEKMEAVEKEADAGDLDAIRRLIAHYDATSGNDAIADKWRARARSLGDAQELYYYAARTFTGAQSELDPEKKRGMLANALDAARRSYASRSDESTQQLLNKINQAAANAQ
jgi:hypothetical protein